MRAIVARVAPIAQDNGDEDILLSIEDILTEGRTHGDKRIPRPRLTSCGRTVSPVSQFRPSAGTGMRQPAWGS